MQKRLYLTILIIFSYQIITVDALSEVFDFDNFSGDDWHDIDQSYQSDDAFDYNDSNVINDDDGAISEQEKTDMEDDKSSNVVTKEKQDISEEEQGQHYDDTNVANQEENVNDTVTTPSLHDDSLKVTDNFTHSSFYHHSHYYPYSFYEYGLFGWPFFCDYFWFGNYYNYFTPIFWPMYGYMPFFSNYLIMPFNMYSMMYFWDDFSLRERKNKPKRATKLR